MYYIHHSIRKCGLGQCLGRVDLEKVVRALPRLPEAHRSLGILYGEQQHWGPAAGCFEQALEVLGTARERTLMIGDQLETDVRGALAIGIDAALVLTGVARPASSDVEPTWIIETLGGSGVP